MLIMSSWQACTLQETPQEREIADGGVADKGRTYRFLTANVGNSDLAGCGKYGIKLCGEQVFQGIKQQLITLKPHVIALQEMLPSKMCEVEEKDTKMVCHHSNKEKVTPIRRLLGTEYSISCEPHRQFDCIAVHQNAGVIEGCDKGKFCTNALSIKPPSHCNQAFRIAAVDIKLGGVSFRLINGHPDSKKFDCRTEHLKQVFEGKDKLVKDGQTLIMGDMNLDPFIGNPKIDSSVALWRKYVGEGKAFHYHSGPAEHDPPYPTDLLGRTIDHVLSDFAKGSCKTLGKAPGTIRIDGKSPPKLSRLDHSAVLCDLSLPESTK